MNFTLKPIFICGCGRSGTTLLGSLLGSHSNCIATPESQFIFDLIQGSHLSANITIEPDQVIKQLSKHWRFKLWNLKLSTNDFKIKEINTYSELIQFIVNTYASQNDKPNASYWIDHTPEHIQHIATLMKLFPEAKFIHIIRDGRAIASSVLNLDWGGLHTIPQIAQWWVRQIGYGLAAENYLGKAISKQVKYENLLLKPEETLKEICTFIGINYQVKMLKGNDYKVPSYTESQHKLIGTKPDSKQITIWKKRLSSRQIEIFESSTQDILSYLGYTPEFGTNAIPITRKEQLSLQVQANAKAIRKRFQRFYRKLKVK